LSSKVTGFDHPLTHNTNTQFQLKPHAVKGREGVKHHENIFSLPAVNSDEADSDDDQCFHQNEMLLCNQSNDMEFTEPLDVNFPNFNQIGLLAKNDIDLTEPLASHMSFDQNWNSQLSSAFDCKPKTKGDEDMTLTETLPALCSGFQDHVKSHGKSKKSSESFVNKAKVDTAEQEMLMKMSSKCKMKDLEAKSNCLIGTKTDTGILTEINSNDISFTEVVSYVQNVDGRKNSVINQSMDLTESLVNVKPHNSIEMFKPSMHCDNGYGRLQPTGRTCICANDFSTTRPQGFAKQVESIEKKMVNVSSLQTKNCIRSSGTRESMHYDSECLHEANKFNVRNTEFAKPARNVALPAFTDQIHTHNVAENVQNFGLITLDGETYMNKMADSSTRCTCVSDMEWIDELKQTESNSAKASSQITDVGDMELTCNVNHKNIHKPFGNSARNSYMQITNEIRKNQISEPVQISSAAAVNKTKFESERQNQPSNLIDMSGLICNATDMEFTSEMKWKEICTLGEMNTSVSDMELVNETRQNQISTPLVSYSHNSIVADMELTSGMKWEETRNSGHITKFFSDLQLTNKTRQKETANPAAFGSHINTTDMELTSGIKWNKTCSLGEMNRPVKNIELTNKTRQKETANPAALSSHINTTDMELTSGMNWKQTCSPGDINGFVEDMEPTNKRRQRETVNPVVVSGHTANVTNMELTNRIKCKETCNTGDVNRHVNDMELINENRQEQTSSPAVVFNQASNITDMGLASGITWKETCNPDVSRCINDTKQTNERREVQMSAKSTSVSESELRNEVRQTKIFNQSRITDLSEGVTDMELSEINIKGICNEFLRASECDSHAKTKIIIRAAETWKEEPRVPFSHMSNNDCINLSEQRQMGDEADVAHSLKSCNMNPVYSIKTLRSNDLEEAAHPELTACISISEDRTSQSNYAEGETSLKQASSSKQTTVQALGRSEKCKAKDSSVTLFKQIDSINYTPVSKETHPNTDVRYNEHTGFVLDTERVNASENFRSMELNIETPVPAVSFNLSISTNVKELGKMSQKFDTKLLHLPGLDQESVNESIQNTANKSSLLHDGQGSENSVTSSDKVSQEDLSMQLLMEERTYSACTAETAKKLSAECNIVGNAESHCNQQFQYATKEKTCTQKNSTENTQVLKNHDKNSVILQEESDGKQGHNQQLTLNECPEHRDLRVRMRTPSEPHGNQIMQQVNSATPVRSRESGVMEENLDCSQLQGTLASMPDEMELILSKDSSHEGESYESYDKLVEDIRKADEIIRESMFMTSDECALLHNSQCAQQTSQEGTLLHKLSNVGNTINESVTMKEESTKHLELKTVTEQEKSNLDQKCMSSIKQTDEQKISKKLTVNQNEDVAMSSLEEQLKAEELRLVIAKKYLSITPIKNDLKILFSSIIVFFLRGIYHS
jgi:hypothetical protein